MKADSNFIKEIIGLDSKGVFIGKLDGYDDIDVYLDLNKLLTNKFILISFVLIYFLIYF